jgi:hypothetical protein
MILKSQKFVYEHKGKINENESRIFIEEIVADSIEDALIIGKMMFPENELVTLKHSS